MEGCSALDNTVSVLLKIPGRLLGSKITDTNPFAAAGIGILVQLGISQPQDVTTLWIING